MLWHVFRMATSMSSVASLAWMDCCSSETRERRGKHEAHTHRQHCYLGEYDEPWREKSLEMVLMATLSHPNLQIMI